MSILEVWSYLDHCQGIDPCPGGQITVTGMGVQSLSGFANDIGRTYGVNRTVGGLSRRVTVNYILGTAASALLTLNGLQNVEDKSRKPIAINFAAGEQFGSSNTTIVSLTGYPNLTAFPIATE